MRLVTRGDLDGLTCALLLQEVEAIDSVALAHPKDVQDGRTEITSNDILANLPYDSRVGLWFDHHASQQSQADRPEGFKGAYGTRSRGSGYAVVGSNEGYVFTA